MESTLRTSTPWPAIFMPEGLPELRPYLRAKYGLPEQAANQIDEYFQALRTKWQTSFIDQEESNHDGGNPLK